MERLDFLVLFFLNASRYEEDGDEKKAKSGIKKELGADQIITSCNLFHIILDELDEQTLVISANLFPGEAIRRSLDRLGHFD